MATLVDDALQPSVLSHERAPAVYVLAFAVAGSLLVLAPKTGSRATPLAAFVWSGGVPNPLTRGDVAFNLADLSMGVGVLLLVAGVLAHAWANRERLFEPF